MKWTPDPTIIPFMDVHEDEPWTSPLIYIVAETEGNDSESDDTSDVIPAPVAESYSAEFVGDVMEGVQTYADEKGVILKVEDPHGNIFPPIDIEYQVPGGNEPPYRVTKHSTNFTELPANVDEVIRYIPCPTNTKDFTFRITAHMSDGQDETADYVIRVWTNYSIGKTFLLEAIHASRCQKG